MIRRVHVKIGYKVPPKHLGGFDLQWETKKTSRLSDLLDKTIELHKQDYPAMRTKSSSSNWSVTAIKDIAH